MAIDKILGNGALDQVADSVFSAVSDSVSEIKAMQKRKAAENVQVVIQALKKIESDLQDKYDGVTTVLEKRVASIKDGKDGQNGVDGRAGKDGRPGRDGAVGPRGANGIDGRNGRDGVDGVSVVNANIDFDGSLIISLSNGRTINVGEVVAPDLAERIKVITNGGGTSQGVLDAIAALQATIATYGTMALQNASAVAITGGAINGTTIGAASASTGAFTTLTTSSTVTLNGGTANGVAYLNASKVLTTGSALTFDGTNLAVGTTTISNANTDVVTVGKNSGTYDASIVVRQFGTGTAAGLQLIAAGDAGAAYNSITSTTSGGTQHWKLGGVAGSAGTLPFSVSGSEQMRLTSTGLGIGTSSPLDRLDVASANTTYRNRIRNTTANEATFLFQNSSSGTATNDGLYLGIVGSLDAYLWNYENNPIIFGTNNTERARITSGGYFKASFDGTYNSATGQFHEFVGNVANGYTVRTRCANASPANHYINEFVFSAASPNNTGALFIECRDSTAARFELRSNGGLANYSANDVNLSDRREKTNFAPAKSYLDTICAIPVQTFNYADQNMEDDPGLTLGVVAQDVQAVAPELVMESNWGTKDEPKMRLSIYQTDLQYALMKALQELKAEFDAYKASHP